MQYADLQVCVGGEWEGVGGGAVRRPTGRGGGGGALEAGQYADQGVLHLGEVGLGPNTVVAVGLSC